MRTSRVLTRGAGGALLAAAILAAPVPAPAQDGPPLVVPTPQTETPPSFASSAMEEAQIAYQAGDLDTAFLLWKLEAESGNTEAMWLIGNMYYSGNGVKEDPNEAVLWYRKAADLGHTESQVTLAAMYRTGNGVSQSSEEAAVLLYAAAEAEHPIAMFDLAEMFLTGEDDTVAQDPFHAYQWYRQSAKRGVIMAQYKLSQLYFSGTGILTEGSDVEPSVIGYIWLEQAFLQADENRENYWSRRVYPLDKVVPTDDDDRTFRQIIVDSYEDAQLSLSPETIARARDIVKRGDFAKL
ncbi:MAG: tetratricopeptide repeat protein [Pseudomonadota bacterium]